MDDAKVILFYETCRLCLKMPGFVNMFQTADLVDDIFLYTGVKVHNADHLPPKICMKCLEIITEAKRLRVIATENDKNMTLFFEDESKYMLHQGCSQQNISSKQDSPSKILGDISKEKEDTNSEANVSYVIKKVVNQRETNDTNNYDGTSSKQDSPSKSLGDISKEKEDTNSEANVSYVIKKVVKQRETNDTNNYDGTSAQHEFKMIFVRKDLFESSETVTSSTKEGPTKENDSCKRKKLDDEGIAEYKCEICNKGTFSTWKKLYLHQRSHNKNIKCSIDACGKKFATKGDLEKHVRTHTGERPYECILCGKTFVQRVTLKVHRETVHAHEI